MNKGKYNAAISYLYALQKHGIKLGLDNTVRLLSLLGNPQDSFKAIHISGTNGKGSTSAMIASILRAAGRWVGLFTSPHLVSFTERIQVGNIEIKEREVVDLTEEIREVIDKSQGARVEKQDIGYRTQHSSLNTHHLFLPTFFEFVTAMAFLYFKRKGVEWVVVETGMGGRLDATNVLVPLVSVITRVSHDHREFLGETLIDIAVEKAGIIKEGVPVVSSAQEQETLGVIAGVASSKGSALFVFGRDFSSHSVRADMYGATFAYEGQARFDNLHVPLCGMHQVENAAVAIKASEVIMKTEPISPQSVREGLAATAWPGRLELIRREGRNYDFLVDGAHNPDASHALADALIRHFAPAYGKIILILGIMADKDMEGIMKHLLPVASEIIFTAPDYARAASPEKLAGYALTMGFESTVSHSVMEALDLAIRKADDNSGPGVRHLIVITGSFYTIGEAKTILGYEGVLARLRE